MANSSDQIAGQIAPAGAFNALRDDAFNDTAGGHNHLGTSTGGRLLVLSQVAAADTVPFFISRGGTGSTAFTAFEVVLTSTNSTGGLVSSTGGTTGHFLQYRGTAARPIFAAAPTAVVGPTTFTKGSDETVNNNTTLQNDDDLLFTGVANGAYHVVIQLVMNSSTVADFKFAFAGVIVAAEGGGIMSRVGQDVAGGGIDITVALVETALTVGGQAANTSIMIEAVIVIDGTGGTVNFQWAQNTAEVSNTIIRAGSSMTVQRMDA